MSCLTHQIDALRWMGGEVESVNCMTKVITERMEGEFLGLMNARMQSGALAELRINWWTSSHRGDNSLWYEMIQACGTKGEAYTMNNRGTFVRLHPEADPADIERFGKESLEGFVPVPHADGSGHARCIIEWVKMLRGEPCDIRTDGRTCRNTAEVAEAAYIADRERREVSLPIESGPWVNASDPEIIAKQFGKQNAPDTWNGGKQD